MKQGPPWIAVVLLLIVFWPAGLFLLYRKIISDRGAVMHSQISLYVVGGVLTLFGCVGLMNGDYALALFFIIGGLALVWRGYRNNRQAQLYRRYINLVVNQHSAGIDNIAKAMGTTYQQAVADLQDMIAKNYFHHAYIDANTRHIVMAQPQHHQPPPRVVRCDGCGADNAVYGHIGRCEYCTSPLQ